MCINQCISFLWELLFTNLKMATYIFVLTALVHQEWAGSEAGAGSAAGVQGGGRGRGTSRWWARGQWQGLL